MFAGDIRHELLGKQSRWYASGALQDATGCCCHETYHGTDFIMQVVDSESSKQSKMAWRVANSIPAVVGFVPWSSKRHNYD